MFYINILRNIYLYLSNYIIKLLILFKYKLNKLKLLIIYFFITLYYLKIKKQLFKN
jgi:hypothetical protein